MKRRLFNARVRFHDWMWQHRNPVARLARRLPLYFSDPYWVKPEDVRRIFVSQPELTVTPGWKVTSGEHPATFTGGQTFTYYLTRP